jgi:hypothetical protein
MVRGITYILDNDTAFQLIAGQNKAGVKYKVFPVIAGENEQAPYSAVRQVGKIPTQCRGSRTTQWTYTYDVASYHKNYEDAEELDNAVREALDSKVGTYNTVKFRFIRFVNTIDGDYDIDNRLFVKISTFSAVVDEDQTT